MRKFGDPYWDKNLIYYSLLKDFYQWYDIPMESQIIINNLLISYNRTAGEQSVLFLHGWRSNKQIWSAVIEGLKDLKIEMVAVDLPGFGKSQISSAPMTVEDYADIVAALIKKLDLKNVVVVGHSFGGRVGIKLSSEYPESISKLILVDSAGFPIKASKKKLFALAAKIIKPFFKPKAMQGLRKKVYQQIGAEDYVATPQLQKTFINITSEDLSEDLKNIQTPTLIINGENDTDTPVEFGKRMSSLINHSKLIILNNAGHFSFLDQPEGFIKVVTNFIKS